MDEKTQLYYNNAKRKLSRAIYNYRRYPTERRYIEIMAVHLLMRTMKRENVPLSVFGPSKALRIAMVLVEEEMAQKPPQGLLHNAA